MHAQILLSRYTTDRTSTFHSQHKRWTIFLSEFHEFAIAFGQIERLLHKNRYHIWFDWLFVNEYTNFTNFFT